MNDESKKFIKNRITELRLQKGVSEYQMSLDLGHSRSYVYNISSGRSLPLMRDFLEICEYLGTTPSQFFDETIESPALINEAVAQIKSLEKEDLKLILDILHRFNVDRE